MRLAAAILCATLASSASAQEAKFERLDGGVLLYDTESLPGDAQAEVHEDDVPILLRYLRSDPDITTLRLFSRGGEVWAGQQMADIIIDFDLHTEVVDVCSSACSLMFLAGSERTMRRGARLGFHSWSWSAANIAAYFESYREEEGWDDPFVFAEWLYRDTQKESQDILGYYVERGVDPGFAIRILREGHDGMWYPRRAEMLEAGVLTR